MGKDKRVALYVRVSTDAERENQKRELEAAAKRHRSFRRCR